MAVAVVIVAIVVSATVWAIVGPRSGTGQSGDTCVSVTMASSMGGGVEQACGEAARDWCRAAYAERGSHAQLVQTGCREAGILS
jgi:hypothetical protein